MKVPSTLSAPLPKKAAAQDGCAVAPPQESHLLVPLPCTQFQLITPSLYKTHGTIQQSQERKLRGDSLNKIWTVFW